jgi:hypothetical protein
LIEPWEEGEKGIHNGFWLFLRDPTTGISMMTGWTSVATCRR